MLQKNLRTFAPSLTSKTMKSDSVKTASSMIRQIEPDTGNTSVCLPRPPGLHPAWLSLIRFCHDLGFGEIERLKIQDGLPVSAEVVRKKIRWS
jgi:hypothetical protein